MNPHSFDVYTIARGKAAVVVVKGEVDMAVAERLDNALWAAVRESSNVVVDLTDVAFIDSSGIGILVQVRKSVADGRLRVVGAGRALRQVFEIAGVADLLLGEIPGDRQLLE
jgi:anti-sigma B factor antagonist